ncbi:response regulator transcription factor [Paracoccus sp. TK19116]|uniref:Response regulator transcription factor n=2 Tax=Paracoccus albicereus TaxID=2922394 RepID=A0ABT1MSX5_9RHOB|nr:response regulator transcription factor [Paracoccus albicereus]
MTFSSVLLFDLNELRLAAFGALFEPWAREAELKIQYVHDPEALSGLSDGDLLACLFSVGSLSLRDPTVSAIIDRIRGLSPNTPLIVLSDIVDSLEIAMAICTGLRGFIPTTMPSHVALAALNFIINGGTYYPHSTPGTAPAMSSVGPVLNQHADDMRVMNPPRSGEPSVVSIGVRQHLGTSAAFPSQSSPIPHEVVKDSLTKRRHVEVLKFLAQGETNKEIARHLNLTEATIKVYVRELMRHFGAKNRMQVALKASSGQGGDIPDLPIADHPDHVPNIGSFSGAARR